MATIKLYGMTLEQMKREIDKRLTVERCMRRAIKRGVDPYNSHDTQAVCFRKTFNDQGRKR